MIKCKKIEAEKKKEEPFYPCLMITRSKSKIVLMSRRGVGVALYVEGGTPRAVEEENWATDYFIPYTGKLELSNE